jgi:prophage DNA circulation protein
LQEGAGYEQISGKLTDSIAWKIKTQLKIVMDKGFNKMSEIIESVIVNQKELQTTSDALANKTESLQKIVSEISNNAKEALVSTDQLSNTMTTYKDALFSVQNVAPQGNSTPPRRNDEDPRLAQDLDSKQCQILLELGKEMTEGNSITELKSKIDAMLREMDSPPPEGMKVQEINKLRNGSLIIQMMTTEAAV